MGKCPRFMKLSRLVPEEIHDICLPFVHKIQIYLLDPNSLLPEGAARNIHGELLKKFPAENTGLNTELCSVQ